MARWLITFEAIDPVHPDKRWKTGIFQAHYSHLQRYGHEKQLARIMLVHHVMDPDSTLRIYQGWSRPGKDDCYVYAGKPEREFKSLTIETPPPPGIVFLVFVLPDGTIDDWTWRPSTAGDGRPDGVMGELIWSANPS
jgi:hypothetical protein